MEDIAIKIGISLAVAFISFFGHFQLTLTKTVVKLNKDIEYLLLSLKELKEDRIRDKAEIEYLKRELYKKEK